MGNSSGNAVTLLGRILICLVFLFSGVSKVMAYSRMAGFAESKGLPLAHIAIGAAATLEILGGLALAAGFRTKIAGWLLFLYMIPTTLLFHNFWTMQGMERMDNQSHFLKNLAIMGGLLILAANGAGGYSLDSKKAKA
ncbi:MAG TPA: DoxX family protein [Candidatus Acidoferrales bacterium]|nr:DoxX family protein [Candidatus Acidoferrales bacterium]